MKRILLLFIVLCAMLSISAESPQNPNTNNNSSDLHIVKNNNERPNAPARYVIECEYSAGNLLFNLPPFVAWGYVEILDGSSIVFDGMVYAESPLLSIPALHGNYTIHFTTDSGAVYSGNMLL